MSYDEFSNLSADLPVQAAPGSPLRLPSDAAGTRWAYGVHAQDAEVPAGYRHPHFGRWAAVTTRPYGAGRITCVGTIPNPGMATALFRRLVPDAGSWGGMPTGVTSTGAVTADGRRLRFLHNWTRQEIAVTAPTTVRDVLAGAAPAAGAELRLGPWDVRVLLEMQ